MRVLVQGPEPPESKLRRSIGRGRAQKECRHMTVLEIWDQRCPKQSRRPTATSCWAKRARIKPEDGRLTTEKEVHQNETGEASEGCHKQKLLNFPPEVPSFCSGNIVRKRAR